VISRGDKGMLPTTHECASHISELNGYPDSGAAVADEPECDMYPPAFRWQCLVSH
jgi:hypothetical protein